jgi:membrane protein DedA with SNARE-associated domain
VPELTADRLAHGKELLMHSSRWFASVLSAISFLVGLSALSIAHFLLHQSLGTSLWIGSAAVIVAIFEGSWRLSCREKDALDPQWREKARALKHSSS